MEPTKTATPPAANKVAATPQKGSEAPKAVKAPKAPKAPKVVDPAKKAKRDAYLAKRAAKLAEIKSKDPIKYGAVITYKEAKDTNAVKDWKEFCGLKAKAMNDIWLRRAEKPQLGEKALERKKNRLVKLKEMIAALEKETASA